MLFCFFLVLFFWLFNTEKNLVFPPEKGIFCLFSVFLFLSPLALLGLPLFLFLFLCLSFFFFSFFLPSCLCFCFLLVPCFCPFLFLSLSSLLFFHERNNMKILTCKFFFLKSFLFFSFLPFFLSSSFFLSLLFPDFKLCFLFNIKVFDFKTKNLKKQFLVKRGLQQNGFFYQPVFCKMSKVIVFFGPFFGNFWLMFKKHYTNRYFSTFFKSKKMKKWPFLIVTNWATLIVTNWATFVQLKNGQRGPVSNY